jgi:phospholipid-translocating ATPase
MYVMLVHMAIEAKSWTILHVCSVVFSIIFFYSFAFIYNSVCKNCFGFENPFWVIHQMIDSPLHWLTILLTVVIAILPRLVIRCMENTLYPSDVTQAILLKRQQATHKDEELFVTWSRSTSSSSVFKERVKCLCWRNLGVPATPTQKPTVPTISAAST